MKVIGALSRKAASARPRSLFIWPCWRSRPGNETLLIDLDPQGSAAAWWRETPQVAVTTPPDLVGILDAAARLALVVLNACPPLRGAGEASLVAGARWALTAFGVPVAPVAIISRAAFASAAVAGLTVGETEPDSKAAREMARAVAHCGKGVEP